MDRITFSSKVQGVGVGGVNYSYFFWDGESYFRKACYGQINEDNYGEGLGIDSLIVFHPMCEFFTKELYDFFMSKEMFGDCFLDTKLENGLTYGWEVNLKQSYQKILGGLIALRRCFTIGQSGEIYTNFRNVGASVKEAVVLNNFLRVALGQIYSYSYANDHQIFGDSLDISSWLEDPTPECETHPALGYGYLVEPVWDLWGFGNGLHFTEEEWSSVGKKVVDSGWNSKTIQPKAIDKNFKMLLSYFQERYK